MGASSNIAMSTSTMTSAMSSVAGAYNQSQALKSQGEYQRMVADTNSNLAKVQADDAVRRGDLAVSQNDMKARQLVGSQRAAAAAQGVDVNAGSAVEMQDNTRTMSALDAVTIRTNAMRQAWGYNTQALESSSRGQFEQMAADNEANNTILTGGMKALSYGLEADYFMNSNSSTRPIVRQ